MEIDVGHHGHLTGVIFSALLLFGIAGIVVPLMQRLRISPVLSYLMCGIVIGPFGLAVFVEQIPWLSYVTIDKTGTAHMLGELGIVALMFMLGLGMSFGRLKELKRFIFGLGSLQIIVSAFVIFIIASMFGNSVQASIVIGASFALSSTAIVMKLIEEQRLLSLPIGILCLSILLMQDLAVVPILVYASSFAAKTDANVFVAITESIIFGLFTVLMMYLLGKRVLRPVLRSVSFSNSPEWLATFIVFIVLGCSALTYAAGLSLALGAFMAGLLIAETEFKHEVEVIISPIKGLLLGIFFLSIGMMIDLTEILRSPFLLLISVIGIYAVKASIILPLCLVFKVPGRQASEAAVYLSQPGEFALLIMSVALVSGLIPADDVQFFMLVTVLAMMLTPSMFKLAPIAGDYGHKFFGEREHAEEEFSPVTKQRTVLIAGFGRAGQLVAKNLVEKQIPFIAFDHDARRVHELRKKGVHVIYGDARKKQLWEQLIDENIEAAVIVINDYEASQNILKSLRETFPDLHIIVRAKDDEHALSLSALGATHVIEEAVELSARISNLLVEQFDEG